MSCRPCARRTRAPTASRGWPRSPPSPSASAPRRSRRPRRRTLVTQPLADEELERRPGRRDVEHPVDLPLAEQAVVLLPCALPVVHLRQASEPERQLGALLDGALEPLLPDRHVEARLAQRVRERAERVPDQRLRRHRPAPLVEVAGGRRPAELLAQLAQQPQQLLPRHEAPRHEPGRALGRVPGAEVLDHGLRMHLRPRVGGELAHRRRPAEPLGGRAQLGEDLLVRVAPPQTGLELGERRLVDPGRDAAPAWASHAISVEHNRQNCNPGRADVVSDGRARLAADERPPRSRAPRRPRRRPGSRAPPAAAAARRCRASCSGSSIPARSTSSLHGCRRARCSSRPRTARRRRARWPRRSSAGRPASRGTAPVRTSSRASPPPCSLRTSAELGLLEVDEGALPEVARRVRPRAVCLGNLFRDQLDRYGELELVAERWRAAVAELPERVDRGRERRRPAGRRPRPRARVGTVRFGLDDPRHARPGLQHAADSKWCIRCGRPYEYAAA